MFRTLSLYVVDFFYDSSIIFSKFYKYTHIHAYIYIYIYKLKMFISSFKNLMFIKNSHTSLDNVLTIKFHL